LRERITLRKRARVVQFADAAARRKAIQQGLGVPVGECFLILTTKAPLPRYTHVNYARPLPRCLVATEDGVLHLRTTSPDLVIAAQLDKWAERTGEDTWRLTQASVTSALQGKAQITDLLHLLQERLLSPMPAWLRVALLAWAGQEIPLEVGSAIVLHCTDGAAYEAVRTSVRLRPYLQGELEPRVFLVDPKGLAALKEELAWAGLHAPGRMSVRPLV
jgi:hypothetical protein